MADEQQFQYIKLPDGSYGKFNAKANDTVIRSAIQKDFPNAFKPFGADALGKATSIGPRPSQGPLIDTIDKARDWLENKATTGSDAGAGEFMESAPLGALRVARGGAELISSPWQATKDIVGGASQAATMPGMVMAPEVAETAAGALPSTARAGRKLEEVLSAAKNVPINAEEPLKASLRGKEMYQHGSPSLPRILRAFNARMADPEAGPMTYKEARDFYTNGRMAMTEYLRNNPTMWRQVTIFKNALGEAVQEAATLAGKGPEYKSAISEYRRAKALQKLAAAAGALGIKMGGLGAAQSFLKSTFGSQ